jgi:hypothetical protein
MWIGAANGRDLILTEKDLGTHMHVIGAPDKGKSRFLENLNRQFITKRHGHCLIDLHGTLYKRLVEWCEYKQYFGRRPILLFEPAASDWAFGFDPFKHEDIDFAVDTLVDAVSRVWGQNLQDTPLLKRCMRATFHALAAKGLTLFEAVQMVNPHDPHWRMLITAGLEHELYRQQWAVYNQMKPYQFNEYFGSTTSRINEFFHDRRMHYIFGQKKCTIDTRGLMDEGGMLLVNLSGISRNTARVLGTMLIHDFFIEATNRPEWPEYSYPFYVVLDECHEFVNPDIGNILNETRKFGLHLILSHQNLAQIREDPKVYDGVMQSAQTKVVLGGTTLEDAKLFAGEIFRFDPEKLKRLTTPVTVRHERVWLKSESESEAENEVEAESSGSDFGDVRSWGDAYGENMNEGVSQSQAAAFWGASEEPGNMEIRSEGAMSGKSSSAIHTMGGASNFSSFSGQAKAHALSSSRARGKSETLQAIIEERQMQTYSLEEQTYEAALKLKFQEPRHAIVRKPDGSVYEIVIPFVDTPYVSPHRVTRFREQVFLSTPCIRRVEEVKQEIEERRKAIAQVVSVSEPGVVMGTPGVVIDTPLATTSAGQAAGHGQQVGPSFPTTMDDDLE